MTQSQTTTLRDELLKQAKTGNAAVDAGLVHLRQIVDAEQARVRRLARWTKTVWVANAALLLVGVAFPFFVYWSREVTARTRAIEAQQASAVAASRAAHAGGHPTTLEAHRDTGAMASPALQFLAPVAVTLLFLGVPIMFIGLVIGVVLLIVTGLARRTAGMHEIRASLASIDAQLRVLAISDSSK